MSGNKQDALALELGDDWSQRRISLLEQKEVIEPEFLEQVAKVLKVPADAIRNFDEEATFNIISNTFSDFKDNAHASALNYHCSFNPIDKWMEAIEEIKKLNRALLKEKDEKIALLEKMMGKKKK